VAAWKTCLLVAASGWHDGQSTQREGVAVMAISRFATLSEVTLHYREAGEGEVLVLLHDCPQTSHAWRHVMPRLASQVRVIAPDLRGLGDSSRPLDGFDIGTLAGDILELLDRLGVPEFSVAGHGHGGSRCRHGMSGAQSDQPPGAHRRCAPRAKPERKRALA
jgi:hypothetical protein